METIIINAEEWKELVQKIDRITEFIEKYTERLPLDDNAWMNETQVCDYLQISSKTLQRLRHKGELTFSEIAKKHHYKVGNIKELLEKHSIKNSRDHIEDLKNSYRERFEKQRNKK